MKRSLKTIIESQLRDNVPLPDIRKELSQRGYELDEINKAVREVISNVDGKISRHIFQLGVLIIGAVIVVGAILYFSYVQKENGGNLPPVSEFREVCRNYPQPSNGIDCEGAVEMAVAQYSGSPVIMEENFAKTFPTPSGTPPQTQWNGWLVRITLDDQITSGDTTYTNVDIMVNADGWVVSQFTGEV